MEQRSKTQIPPGTQAVVRAIAILKAMARPGRGFGITELAGLLELSKAVVFRLLGALEAEGIVVRDALGDYRLGPELITLGASALGSTDLSIAAHDELVALVDLTGETATLEVLIGTEALIIGEVQGRFLLGSAPDLGRRSPAHVTSTGKVLLALTQPAPPWGDLKKRTPKTITSRRELELELERVRVQGYAIASEELEVGFTALAAPVRNHFGNVVAALSINGPSARLRPAVLRDLVGPVCDAANRISRRLGATQAMLGTPPAERKADTGRTTSGKSRATSTSRKT
ncbi:MAG TPA: IclR family transcriptional regulator [Gemmatimonadaceae bacterium]|nr:IclR family transcriptional regulator [Gemmatimonadaceae bacterium]